MALYLQLIQPLLAALNNETNPLFTGGASNMSNATQNATISSTPTPFAIPTDISSLLNLIYSFAALRDWFKLALIGLALEACRRLYTYGYSSFIDQFFISASFESDDIVYDWMLLWLSRLPQWREVREFTVSTSSFGISEDEQEDDDEDGEAAVRRRKTRKVKCIPSYTATYKLWYKGRWMSVSRVKDDQKWGWQEKSTLYITILARKRAALDALIEEARDLYMASRSDKIDIFANSSGYSSDWSHVASRPKRPLESIILDAGVKELVLDDARDFMQSKKWYGARGIPFRRGYLLYGPPGSGKTSIVHSLAGELELDIYIISLSKSGMDDSTLNSLISGLPEHCIALMEDIDAAFTSSLNRSGMEDAEKSSDPRDPNSTDPNGNNGQNGQKQEEKAGPSAGSRITLSGLLNALDGVSAQEGRLLFATTNRYDVLDPALTRPGRMDLHVEFQLASRFQAQEMFRRFYVPDNGSSDVAAEDEQTEKESVDSGYATPSEKGSPKTVPTAQLVDVSSSPSEPLSPVPSVSVSPLPKPVPVIQSGGAPQYQGIRHSARAPKLSRKQVERLAAEFASRIPERELAMANLQGYLMKYKIRPFEAVDDIEGWVEEKREAKRRKEAKNQKTTTTSVVAPVKAEGTSE